MAIQITKTLQGVVYTLYVITDIALTQAATETLNIQQTLYQSQGHFNDDFLPIIKKRATITNQARIDTVKLLLRNNYSEALDVVENFLVNNVAYYAGGTVIPN